MKNIGNEEIETQGMHNSYDLYWKDLHISQVYLYAFSLDSFVSNLLIHLFWIPEQPAKTVTTACESTYTFSFISHHFPDKVDNQIHHPQSPGYWEKCDSARLMPHGPLLS